MPRGVFLLLSISFSCLFAIGCGGQTQENESLKPLTVDLAGGVKMEFVLLPKGTFTMGSPEDETEHNSTPDPNGFHCPENQHDVEISKPFYMAKYLVTQGQYEALMGVKTDGSAGKQFPVGWVTWPDAQAFCKKMGHNDKQGRRFRLPTEAEWEYACRAASKTAYYFGDDPQNLGDYAWFKDNADGIYHAVGEKKPNAWGLFDMHGNVWQWCEDYWGSYEGLNAKDPLRSVDPSAGTALAGSHVLRGGSWIDAAKHCRAACRMHDQLVGSPYYGFRVAFCPD